MKKENLRQQAFEEFKRIAKAETANGCETLALFNLVSKFSTAPQDETVMTLVCMRYWSRHGDGDALIQFGTELYHGGYNPDFYKDGPC